MFLNSLNLINFRNFSSAHLGFTSTTLLLGKNAQGKSNILESVYFLATTKSLRAEKDLHLIKEGESFLRVEGEIVEDQKESGNGMRLEIAMQKIDIGVEKRLKVNGVARRVTDYLGNLAVVYFAPEDINLVTGPPALRRWHLDLTLAQVDKEYKKAISSYSQALTSRNRILRRVKEGLAKIDELDFWTEEMVSSGEVVAQKRELFFESLSSTVLKLPVFNAELRFIYQSNLFSKERVKQYLPREIAAGQSLIGPQRDDFIFEYNDKNLAYFGSRGEQRTAVLELKLAELKFITQTKEVIPVLLLDDVFSELDEEHRQLIFSIVLDQQTILSVVEEEQVPQELLSVAKIFRVEKGVILP